MNIIRQILGILLITISALHGQYIEKKSPLEDYTEKVKLITDRNVYVSGEKIWYFASISSNRKNCLSKTLYVELYSEEHRVQQKISIEKGFCEGFIEIPAEFKSSGYLMRAYTTFLRNYLPEQFAHQVLFIINPKEGVPRKNITQKPAHTTRKLTSTSASNTFHTILKNSEQKLDKLAIEQQKDRYRIELSPQGTIQNKNLRVLVRNSQFKIVANEELAKKTYTLPSNLLTYGINYFTIIDKKTPLAIGCIYVDNRSVQKISKTTDNRTSKTRANVSLPDLPSFQNNKAIISVIRKGTKFRQHDSTFAYHLITRNPFLLNSYNQIFPESASIPQSYVKIALQNHIQALQKNAEFLKKIVRVEFEHIPEIHDLSISGVLEQKSEKKPVSNHIVFLSLFGIENQLHTYKTKENGSFIFNIENSTGIKDAYITADRGVAGEVNILVKNSFSNLFYNEKIPMIIDTSYRDLIAQMYLYQQLEKQFNISDSIRISHFDPLPAIERNTVPVYLKDYIALPTMEEVFREIIPNASIKKRNGKPQFYVSDNKRLSSYAKPLLLVDNIPIFDYKAILGLTPSKVEKIYVIDEPYYIGNQRINGIISIHTLTNDFGGIKFNGNAIFLKYMTYTPVAKFIQHITNNPHQPNFSTTLFWKADLWKNAERKFKTDDGTGAYDLYIYFLDEHSGLSDLYHQNINVIRK